MDRKRQKQEERARKEKSEEPGEGESERQRERRKPLERFDFRTDNNALVQITGGNSLGSDEIYIPTRICTRL